MACLWSSHYSDIIMSMMASQITGVSIVCFAVCSGTDQRKHQSSMSLVFVRGIHQSLVDSPHKGPVMQKMFPSAAVVVMLHVIIWFTVLHYNSTDWSSRAADRLCCVMLPRFWLFWTTFTIRNFSKIQLKCDPSTWIMHVSSAGWN